MTSLGEIDITLTRGPISVRLKALVMDKLQADCFGGTTFHFENDVQPKIKTRTIKLHNKYTLPQTNEQLPLVQPSASAIQSQATATTKVKPPSHTFLNLNRSVTVLPDGNISIPYKDKALPSSCSVAVQPINNLNWPPQICEVVDNSVVYANCSKQPLIGDKTTKFLCLPISTSSPVPNLSTPPPSKAVKSEPSYPLLILQNTNTSILSPTHMQALSRIHTTCSNVFNSDLSSGYNGKSGKFFASLSFKSDQLPESKQCPVPLYNHKCLALQQQLMDSLEDQGVLVDPQKHNINVKKVSPSFILQKGRAKHKKLETCSLDELRWVVAFNNLNDDLLPRPSKQTSGRNVLTFLAKYKFHIHADLFNSYFQIPVRRQDWEWLGIRTPFRGIRVLTRSGQGLLNSETELDELISRVLGDEIFKGICYAERDDIIVGGNSIDETIKNWETVLTKLENNNLKVSPSKVKIFPKDIEVFGHRIVDNEVHPSPHILTSLGKSSINELKTVKQVNSWKGLYKTLLSSLPGLAHVMDPFDKEAANKDSKAIFTWTPELIASFNKAMTHLGEVNKLTLPHPDEQLILMPDGARTPCGIGWALFVQRIVNGKTSLLPVQFYSAKLKPYMQKWLPCEIEGVAASMAINASSHWILSSNKPTYVTPDCKAVVQAVNRMRLGKLSRNPRLQAILISINRRPVTFIHSSAKTGQHVIPDHASRLDITCGSKDCAVERFLDEIPDNIQCMAMSSLSDLISDAPSCFIAATATDNMLSLAEGNQLPLGDKSLWLAVQESDKDISSVKDLLVTGDSPRKNSTRMVKTIHRHASIHEGLVVVKETDNNAFSDFFRIVIPKIKVPTILSLIHLKGNHPSQYQSEKVFSRYFFCPGFRQSLDDFYNQCFLCNSVKKSTTPRPPYREPNPPEHPGISFNIDVLKRAKQIILVCTDIFSKYTTATIIPSESADDQAKGIISLVTPVRRSNMISVKVDAHPSFKSLSKGQVPEFNKSGISLTIGNVSNKNSNCHVDKVIQELEHEIRKSKNPSDPLTVFDLANATYLLNSRIRRQDLSSAELMFCRDQNTNKLLKISDNAFVKTSRDLQINQQHKTERDQPETGSISPGMMVMFKKNPSKHERRKTFIVTTVSKDIASVRKILNIDSDRSLTLSSILHNVHINEIFQINPKLKDFNQTTSSVIEDATVSTWLPVHGYDTDSNNDMSDDDVEDFANNVHYNLLPTVINPPLELNITSSQDILESNYSSRDSLIDDVFQDCASSDGMSFDDEYDLAPFQLQRKILEKHRRIALRCRIGTSSLESLKKLENQSRQLAHSSTRDSLLGTDDFSPPVLPKRPTRLAKSVAYEQLHKLAYGRRHKKQPSQRKSTSDTVHPITFKALVRSTSVDNLCDI